ncbi:MAG: hypothetical protein H6685_06475 [Deltaproteobacteria bacterium]|nr:hypothetical protein [Deltaproteobacteria bacterium]
MPKSSPKPPWILGVDAGGTHTRAVLATMDGRVRGLGFADGANFQGCGVRTAQKQIESAIQAAMKAGRIGKAQVACAAYGISGADREKDFDTVAEFLAPVNPAERFVLSNDTTLALRAGTHDGVGVACIAGTGSNTMGFNAAGDHIKVGGFGGYSGDYGSSFNLTKKAVVAAMKEWDGRGPKTLLTPLLCEALGVEEICDIIEYEFWDNHRPLPLNKYTPLLFDAANAGDKMALKILRETGRQCGDDALSCLRRLFPNRSEAVHVVLGGSIYQKGSNPTMVDTLTARVKRFYPNAVITRLHDEPVTGALLLAADLCAGKTAPKKLQTALRRGVAELVSKRKV